MSIPMPGGLTIGTASLEDASEVIAVQGAARNLEAMIERRKSKLPAGMKDRTSEASIVSDIVREAFANGMETPGVEGKLLARAAIDVGKTYGLTPAEVTSAYMDRKHFEAADRSRLFSSYAMQIPSASLVPKPPVLSKKPPKGEHHTSQGQKASAQREQGSAQQNKRKALWKW
jgi:hypothetical protein